MTAAGAPRVPAAGAGDGPLLLVNAAEAVTCAGAARARRGAAMGDAAVRAGVGVALLDGRVAAVAPDDALRARFPDAREVDCDRGVIAPGFVDAHTHAFFGAPRVAEHELRATGVPYLEIARRGGGSTARCATSGRAPPRTSWPAPCRAWNGWPRGG